MPVELSRTVRFCLRPDGALDADAPVSNSFAAWPPVHGLGRYYELGVTCVGEPDGRTGYFMNIKQIDAAARSAALPRVAEFAGDPDRADRLGELLRTIMTALDAELDGAVTAVRLTLTPTVAVALDASDMATVRISQQFDFAAAHRLHVPDMSPAENVATFGKCNNPNGHGHNYRLEVTVRAPIDPAGRVTPVAELDALVDRVVIDKLDHKNLDKDVAEFADANTSVENIARVVYGLLAPEVPALGVELDQVTVWETAKTSCTYRG